MQKRAVAGWLRRGVGWGPVTLGPMTSPVVTHAHTLLPVYSTALVSPNRRIFARTTRLREESTVVSQEHADSALNVATRVNAMKRQHQTGGSPSSKKQLEMEAWTALNSLTEEQVNAASGKAVSLMLNEWAYFAKFWENGKDGPSTQSAAPPRNGE